MNRLAPPGGGPCAYQGLLGTGSLSVKAILGGKNFKAKLFSLRLSLADQDFQHTKFVKVSFLAALIPGR